MAYDLNQVLLCGQLLQAAYAIDPSDTTNHFAQPLTVDGTTFTTLSTIFANDLATDASTGPTTDEVSIGLILQAPDGGVYVVIRGTDTFLEWIQDAKFAMVQWGHGSENEMVDDGFFDMYASLVCEYELGPASVISFLDTLKKPVTITGHSLGASIATLLAKQISDEGLQGAPSIVTFGSPRTGNAVFAEAFNRQIPNSGRFEIAADIVPKLPFLFGYEHVDTVVPLPSTGIRFDLHCYHAMSSYLNRIAAVTTRAMEFPLDPNCRVS